ncbi:hypothetical protein BDC45DRAFT_501234 [Circinella umbellata]|nr:hypothetical protein BDC45DRAFT_501234 [Circinella umbellata]
MQKHPEYSAFKLLKPSTINSTSSSSSSTDKVILDYLLYISIQAQLKQTNYELEKSPSPSSDTMNDCPDDIKNITILNRRQDKQAIIDSTVTGIFSSNNNINNDISRYYFTTSPESTPFQQRLNLYLLSNHVLARYDAISNDHVIIRRRRNNKLDDKEHTLFTTPISPVSCRRHHRRPTCESCPTRTTKKKSGLMDSIPVFLKTSADLLRRALDNSNNNNKESDNVNNNTTNEPSTSSSSSSPSTVKPMVFAGQQVMGGGMPPTWYDLFLNLLTQAAIECYLCDGQTGPESIFEIFSYGYVEDEDEPDVLEDEDDEENDDDTSDAEDSFSDEELWSVKAADHHLLFPKTRTMYLFKTQVQEREKEFLDVDKENNLQQHFNKLAQRYPLFEFEKSMHEFISMVFNSMDVPALDKVSSLICI